MINKRKVNAFKELFDGRMKIKLGKGMEISKTERKKKGQINGE